MLRLRKYCCVSIACLTILFTGSCSQDLQRESKRTILQFGTLIEITLYGVEPGPAEILLDKLEADYIQYHADWTPWENSPLRQTNQLIQKGRDLRCS